MHPRFHIYSLYSAFLVIGVCIWIFLPELDHSKVFLMPSEAEVIKRLPGFLFSGEKEPPPTREEGERMQLGKSWFFDSRFSKNGKISCATCHQPEKSFSDGLPVGQGLGQVARRTPSLFNVRFAHWFFWDGLFY